MADFQKMYLMLFNAATDAISLLQQAQAETEDIYIEQEDTNITLLRKSEDSEHEPEG